MQVDGVSFSRRAFLMSAAAAPALAMETGGQPAKGFFREPSRDLPIGECDVIVAGGGPAGISAAVSAARAGAKVRLFEMHGALGGVWTSGFLGCLIDFDKSDTDREILRRLKDMGVLLDRNPHRKNIRATSFVYDPECMKVVCEEMCTEAGVEFFLHTAVVAAHRDPSGRNIETVVTESKDGRRAWRAKMFIDCTGDGDLSAQSGCGFDVGGPGGTNDQPASLCAMVASPHPDRIAPYVVNHPSNLDEKGRHAESPKKKMREEMIRAGLAPSYSMPTLFMVREGIYVWMMNHVYGLKVDDAAGITRETVRVRREVLESARALAKLGGVWDGFCVVATAEQLCHRAARRVHDVPLHGRRPCHHRRAQQEGRIRDDGREGASVPDTPARLYGEGRRQPLSRRTLHFRRLHLDGQLPGDWKRRRHGRGSGPCRRPRRGSCAIIPACQDR